MDNVPLTTVLREWGRIGLIGFGGPPAHIALLRELCVERRGWVADDEFEDANAACGLLPGPASTQMAIYCAHRVAGVPGALLGGVAFIVPGLVMIIVLAASVLTSGAPDWLLGAGAGAGAAVVPVVAAAGLGLTRTALRDHRGWRLLRALAYLAAAGATVLVIGAWVVLVLLACGLVELAIRRAPTPRALGLHAWPIVFAASSQLLPLSWTALKVGALSYGGGFVIIPLMQADAVDTHGWMTQAQFLNAVAFGQLTPGPVVQTVAVVGYAAGGLGGALLASVIAFAPSFLFVLVLAPRFHGLRANVTARAFLDGAGPAAIGAILGASLLLLDGVHHAWQWVLLAAAALALIARASPLVVLVAGLLIGVAAWALGAPV
jgi:chromate transporter